MVVMHNVTPAEARPITAHRHDQLASVHAALTALAPGRYGRFDVGSGAEMRQVQDHDSVEDAICIRKRHPFGSGECCMTERASRSIRGRLGQIALAFRHENVWGGEDALAQ